MSKAMARSKPASRASRDAPTTPAAGPERTVRTACAPASDAEIMPPLDCITRSDRHRVSRSRSCSESR